MELMKMFGRAFVPGIREEEEEEGPEQQKSSEQSLSGKNPSSV